MKNVPVDLINHPPHYVSLSPEPIDVIESWGLGYHLATTLKYIARAGKKEGAPIIQDLEKARWYLSRKIERLKKLDSIEMSPAISTTSVASICPSNTAIQAIPQIRSDHPRGAIRNEHATEHYQITEWVLPTPDSPHHKFFLSGPGVNGMVYVATGESCGAHQIKSLEKAYQAGMKAKEYS